METGEREVVHLPTLSYSGEPTTLGECVCGYNDLNKLLINFAEGTPNQQFDRKTCFVV